MNYNHVKSPLELLNFMKQNIKYGFVSKDGKIYDNPLIDEWQKNWFLSAIIQDGNSLLKTKYGTCFDQVELEREWFLYNKYDVKTIFIWFDVNVENDLPTHTFLVYEENDKFYWFEHAFYDKQGIHEFSKIDEVIECVKKEHLNYAIRSGKATSGDYDLIKICEYSKPSPNISISEYFEHIMS